jgi:hypothetical protein
VCAVSLVELDRPTALRRDGQAPHSHVSRRTSIAVQRAGFTPVLPGAIKVELFSRAQAHRVMDDGREERGVGVLDERDALALISE